MKILVFFLQHSRKTVIASVLLGLLSGVCNAALLAAINAGLRGNHNATLLWSFGGLCGLLLLARFTSEVVLTKMVQKAMFTSRMNLCQQVLVTPLSHLERLGAARLLTTLTEDIPTITGVVGIVPVLCVNAALVIGCLVYMATLSWLLFALTMGFMVLGVAGYQLPIMKVHKLFRGARKNAEALQGHLRAMTHGTKELKIHRARRLAFMKDQLEATAAFMMRNTISALRLYSAAASWGQALVFIVIGFYLFFLPKVSHFNIAALTGYTLAFLYMMSPLQAIMNNIPQLGRANVAVQSLKELGFSLMNDKPEEFTDTPPPENGWQTLTLQSVTHTHTNESDSGTFVLGPIDLRLEAGEMVFITGGNGSGKTTLVKLITGLYVTESGGIYLDEQPITDHNIEWYRQHFSVVFSDFYLFEQLLGLDGPSATVKAQRYLQELKLAHKVEVVDGRLSTTDLSQGQRKRLALLTAYLEDRPIYVFDEWAADQDPYFKNIFYMHLLPELKSRGKTVLVISHDDRYYSVADRVIKLNEGQIVGDVTPLVAIASAPLPKESVSTKTVIE
jgi:putative ATP-binding cassette transporter